ncbi:ribokinase [Pseudovibrio sp. Tun.PSC04-5.I4]|uniref:ribokinase n=1 Tax=Pseudovibrio sp. Tun.PSC04-5.I4 TaxID=1798213 RepID=UPI00088178FA|nr:ribokinase [Pseudovibrio sp. Tun.PSC04-5.I4]SDQ97895.1 ribokinase [Pseudovibrio sp. Tun.PSC04-5.I4]
MSIVIVGSINVDITTRSEKLPRPGETLHGDSYSINLGGKGCNQAVAVSKLGGDVQLVGRIGKDGFGDIAETQLKDMGVATDHVLKDENNGTGIAVIGVDANSENCITVVGGANMAVSSSDITQNKELLENAKLLMLQLEIPAQTCLAAAKAVQASGGRVVFDPAPAPVHGLPEGFLRHVDVITPNETETEVLTGFKPTNPQEAAKAADLLRQMGVPAAVVKLGAHGVYFKDETSEGFVKPYKVDSIDSVAAGDCFNGGLAYALSQGKNLGDAVRFAAACGALSTTKRGAATSAPTLKEVEELMG